MNKLLFLLNMNVIFFSLYPMHQIKRMIALKLPVSPIIQLIKSSSMNSMHLRLISQSSLVPPIVGLSQQQKLDVSKNERIKALTNELTVLENQVARLNKKISDLQESATHHMALNAWGQQSSILGLMAFFSLHRSLALKKDLQEKLLRIEKIKQEIAGENDTPTAM